MQEQLGETAFSLKQGIVTSWNSTYDMKQCIVNARKSLMLTMAINCPILENTTNENKIVIGRVQRLQRRCKQRMTKCFKNHTSKAVFENLVQNFHKSALFE
jgi:hypothetical protein